MRLLSLVSCSFLLLCSVFAVAAPTNFDQAKRLAQRIHAPEAKSFYCDCNIRWQGKKGIPDLAGCGYQVRKNGQRANRIEWEHVMPAHHFGHQRQCWQDGGRKNCVKTDSVFRAMEADLYNLVPAIGEVNGDRSNYRFGVLPSTPAKHGACPVKVDFKQQVFEPAPPVRGDIARIYFYMADKYKLNLSRAQQQLFIAWHRQDPVTAQERQLNQRIQQHMGHDNPFVSGKREWNLGDKPTGYGLQANQ
ncbi:endonuclease [Rheinheimera sp. YQF-2]|uniref:Endonuclease n=1 Tax=Rheinheimera lutimaris TaxID=2740584 RepID=A0A7Y5EK10_9GAMM|nr:endonuclease [Rheinheimera lutimaris]NRQ41653.1 endonuclease [Rheinheimera lutimaris]